MSNTLERIRFIELLLHWEGGINAAAIGDQFSLSEAQSRAVLKQYQQEQGQLPYCTSQKRFLAPTEFTPQVISENIDNYLLWFETGCLARFDSLLTHRLEAPGRVVTPAVMRGLIEGLRRAKRVDVEYVSLSNPDGEGRIIAPHSLVNTGGRWHVRAYCEKSKAYRDFVLSRFRGTSEPLDKSANTVAQDVAWNTEVDIQLQADSRLATAQRKVIEQDYQMINGQKRISVRACNVNYMLRYLQISTKTLDMQPEAQQLICTNLAELRAWLL